MNFFSTTVEIDKNEDYKSIETNFFENENEMLDSLKSIFENYEKSYFETSKYLTEKWESNDEGFITIEEKDNDNFCYLKVIYGKIKKKEGIN